MIKLLYKPSGVSSFKFIKQFAKENFINKIGHTGTLDPLACGLIMIATDEDTKLIPYLDKGKKTYVTKVKFGYISDTFDSEGDIKVFENAKLVNLELLNQKLIELCSKTSQLPPIFSAKKIGGKKAYELARSNHSVNLKPVQIQIFQWSILDWNLNQQEALISFEVSRGTYIRSLVHDLGQLLNSGAIMTGLERIKLAGMDKTFIEKDINPLDLIQLPYLKLSKLELVNLFNGKQIKREDQEQEVLLIYCKKIVGIGKIKNNLIITDKLFGNVINKLLGSNE